MKAFVYDAVRTPRGKAGKGSLAGVRPVELVATVLSALAARRELDTSRVGDLVVGCSSATGEQGGDIGRTAALWAGWSDAVAGATVSRMCCSGVDAIATVAAKVDAGVEQLAVAAGVESMSRVGMFEDRGPIFADPEVAAAAGFLHIGVAADLLATTQGLSRRELDRWAVRSHRLAAQAQSRGAFAGSLVPVTSSSGEVVLVNDEVVRPGLADDDVAKLPPLFGDDARRAADVLAARAPGVEVVSAHTLATAPKMVDGAAAAVIGAHGALGTAPRARVLSAANVAVRSPLLTGATLAVERALERAGLALGDVDLFEINESYSAVPLHFLQHTGVDEERVNVNGGALALGHPLGATGVMLLSMLLDELERRDLSVGALAIPAAAGLGSAVVVERVT